LASPHTAARTARREIARSKSRQPARLDRSARQQIPASPAGAEPGRADAVCTGQRSGPACDQPADPRRAG
jgi:hypothetical protein